MWPLRFWGRLLLSPSLPLNLHSGRPSPPPLPPSCYVWPPYLSVSPLPGLQYGRSLLLVPVDVGNVRVASKVLKHLLGSHQLEHGLQGLGTKKWQGGREGRGREEEEGMYRMKGGGEEEEEDRNMSRRRGC